MYDGEIYCILNTDFKRFETHYRDRECIDFEHRIAVKLETLDKSVVTNFVFFMLLICAYVCYKLQVNKSSHTIMLVFKHYKHFI